MRLEKIVIGKIKDAIYDSFGNVNIYLFGSRTDDMKKGGDIDIAIDVNLTATQFRKNKIKFLLNLFKKDFDLKIDIVNYNTKDSLLKKQIEKNAILIWDIKFWNWKIPKELEILSDGDKKLLNFNSFSSPFNYNTKLY